MVKSIAGILNSIPSGFSHAIISHGNGHSPWMARVA